MASKTSATAVRNPDSARGSTSAIAQSSTLPTTKFLRVKRKRGDAPFSTILVKDECGRLRKRRSLISALEALSADASSCSKSEAASNTTPSKAISKRYVFKRFRTVDMAEASVAKRQRHSHPSETALSGRTVCTAANAQVGRDQSDASQKCKSKGPPSDCLYTSDTRSAITCNGKPLVRIAVPILAPDERPIDEAVWLAFQTGSFEEFFKLVAHGTSVNYQRRAADNTTALMAAAHHGNRQVAEELLHLGADLLLQSNTGMVAVDIAAAANHKSLASWLREQVMGASASVESRRIASKTPPSEFVYDIYQCCDTADVDIGKNNLQTSAQATARAGSVPSLAGKLQPSPSPQRPLFLHIGRNVGACGIVKEWTVGGREVEAVDNLEWELGEYMESGTDGLKNVDDEDSNDEDYWANDYPDEEAMRSSSNDESEDEKGYSSEDFTEWHHYGGARH